MLITVNGSCEDVIRKYDNGDGRGLQWKIVKRKIVADITESRDRPHF